MDDITYTLHGLDVSATTDPTDTTPIWIDAIYWDAKAEGEPNYKSLQLEMNICQAKDLVRKLGIAIALAELERE